MQYSTIYYSYRPVLTMDEIRLFTFLPRVPLGRFFTGSTVISQVRSLVFLYATITIINRCLEQLFRNAPAPPPPPQGHPLQQGGKFMDTSSFSTGMTMVD